MAWVAVAPDVAKEHWPDAVNLDADVLTRLLEAAHEQCVEFAPVLAEEDTPPTRYVLANILQARELYAAAQRGEQDVIGVGDYAIRARPLTAAVKQLLRPQAVSWTVG